MADRDDEVLQEILDRLNEAGYAGEVYDPDWRLFGVTEDYKVMIAAGHAIPDVGIGNHVIEPAMEELRESWPAGPTRETMVRFLEQHGGAMAGASGGIAGFRDAVDERLLPIVDCLEPVPMPPLLVARLEIKFGEATLFNDIVLLPIRNGDGDHLGAIVVVKPAVGAATLGMLALGDERLFERMIGLIVPGQRPGAVMFGDLEGSTSLARRLPSSVYFRLIQRLSLAIDEVVVDAGAVVGKHVGDGVTAFFLSEERGSDTATARACIEAARAIQERCPAIAAQAGLEPGDVVVRFGLHWGASLYVGRLVTAGRLEVTALGDEVNECARIESSATGGARLASKPLIERLDPDDLDALGLDPMTLSYTPLADLEGSSEKARRDAPTISVCTV